MMRETGCDGVVVGRGCLGKPWLFRELTQAFAGQPIDPAPTLGDVVEVMRRHLALLVAYKRTPQLGVRAFRKHLGWYLTGFAVGPSLRRALMDADTAAELDALFDLTDPKPGCRPQRVTCRAGICTGRDPSRCRPAGANRPTTRRRRGAPNSRSPAASYCSFIRCISQSLPVLMRA